MKFHQTATYWEPTGARDAFATNEYPSAVAIKVRWEDKRELFIDRAGEQTFSKAIVYCQDVLASEGYLAKGDFTDSNPNPISFGGAHKIRTFSVIPNISGRKEERAAWL